MEATVSTIGLRLLEEETLIGGSEDQTLSFIINILEKVIIGSLDLPQMLPISAQWEASSFL